MEAIMFLSKIDWKNPRFSRWNLYNLGEMNKAQRDAFFADEFIDFPDFTESELIDLCKKVPCRVELFHSNVCFGAERSWPRKLFHTSNFNKLYQYQKQILYTKMEKYAVLLYKKYVDEDRLRKRRKRRSNRALAPYYEERRLRNCFNRIKSLGDAIDVSDSEHSISTVINTMDNGKDTATNRNINQNESYAEIETQNRIIYKDSSDEDDPNGVYLSVSDVTSNTTSPFQTPNKELENIIPINTPTIENLRQLRNRLIQFDSNIIQTEQNIAMIVEIETTKRHEIPESNENIDLPDDDSSASVDRLNIDNEFDNERYNDLISESWNSSSRPQSESVLNDNDEESVRSFATPKSNSNEFVINNSFDRNKLRSRKVNEIDGKKFYELRQRTPKKSSKK